jgi:hypothetical protein
MKAALCLAVLLVACSSRRAGVDAGPVVALHDASEALHQPDAEKSAADAVMSAPTTAQDATVEDLRRAGGDAVQYPACHWPAALDPTDAGDGRCVAKRYRLACESNPSGVLAGCISNDVAQCPGNGTVVGTTFTCHHVCAPDEYGVVCGQIGPGVVPDPPAGCHDLVPTPGGFVFSCCPCAP